MVTEEGNNTVECGECAYFDGNVCVIDLETKEEDEIIEDCENFEYSIYYEWERNQ